MSMSTFVMGIKPPDEKWISMKKVWDSCKEADIEVPRDVMNFFDGEPPDEKGVVVDVLKEEWKDDMREGYEVNLSELDKDIKILRFYNSW